MSSMTFNQDSIQQIISYLEEETRIPFWNISVIINGLKKRILISIVENYDKLNNRLRQNVLLSMLHMTKQEVLVSGDTIHKFIELALRDPGDLVKSINNILKIHFNKNTLFLIRDKRLDNGIPLKHYNVKERLNSAQTKPAIAAKKPAVALCFYSRIVDKDPVKLSNNKSSAHRSGNGYDHYYHKSSQRIHALNNDRSLRLYRISQKFSNEVVKKELEK